MSASVVKEAIPKCMFYVGMGSNDYLNNYIVPAYFTQDQYSPQKFAEYLIHQYKSQLIVRSLSIAFLSILMCNDSIVLS